MSEVPTRLQCAYCQRNHCHGGECYKDKFNDTGCLAFLLDPKGCIRNGDARIYIPLYYKFPPLNVWCSDWTMNGVDTEINIQHIKGLDWDVKKGYLIVYCNYYYYINEYHEDYQSPKSKPVLKIKSMRRSNLPMKCPYCKGKNLYLKRTSPIEQWGCKDCERKIKIMRENGMNDKDIKKVICNA